MKKTILFIILAFFVLILKAQTVVTPSEVITINTNLTAFEGHIYKDAQNNLFYIGTSSGLLKLIGDISKVNSTLSGDGSLANPLGIAQQSAIPGQVLSWSGTAWVPVNAAPAVTSVSNAIAGGQLITTVNGVNSNSVTLPTPTGIPTYIIAGNNTSVNGNGTLGWPYTINVPSATATNLGVIQLTGHLSGSASWPTIADDAITSAKIANYTIETQDIKNQAITTNEIADGTITNLDIGVGEIYLNKIQNLNPSSLLGNPTSSSAPPSQITLGTGLTFSNNVLNVATTSTTTVSNVFSWLQLTTTVNGVSANPVTFPVATPSVLGFITLGGDLGGTAYNPLIGDGKITYPKMQNISPKKLLGNHTTGYTSPKEISLGPGLTFSNDTLKATNNGTVTSVTGTPPIVITGTPLIPNVTITRNNIVTGTSVVGATNPLVLDAGATSAVVGGSNATLTVNNTAPLWNANQLRGKPISTTVPTVVGQILRWDGTNWTPYIIPSDTSKKKLVLSAEYPGAIITPPTTGDHKGNLTGDNTRGTAPLYMNYYKWIGHSSSGTHTYQVIVRITLPNDFTSWQTTDAVQIYNKATLGSSVKFDIYRESSTAIFTTTPITYTTFTSYSLLDSSFPANWVTRGQTVVFVITLNAASNGEVWLGDIILNYK